MLMFPRGLITAVLALQVLDARGQPFFYLSAMAFTVVLFTNVFVVVAAVQAKKGPAADSVPKIDATAAAAAEPEATV